MLRRWLNKLLGVRSSLPILDIYTDGSLKKGRGSWAFLVVKDGVVIQESAGRAKRTTSLRMEFKAAIEALKALPPASKATIHSDARVMIDCVKNAKAGKRKASRPGPPGPAHGPNEDLITLVKDLCRGHAITWKWVRAHSGVRFNERCDELCAAARAR